MEVMREGLPLSITLIKPGSVDTPYMEHARNHLGSVGTTNPPRAYAPEVVANGIAWACTNHIRDLAVGGAGWLVVKAGQLAPTLTDLGMAAFGRMMQTSDTAPRAGMRDNLTSSARAGETRSNQQGTKARELSLFMQAQMNPLATFAIGASLLALTLVLKEARTKRA